MNNALPAQTTADTVAQVRKHFAAVRTMNRNVRLGRYEGRNSGGNTHYHLTAAEEKARSLPRELQGLVWGEHRLAERISENRDAGQERPELRARIAADRRRIRDLAA